MFRNITILLSFVLSINGSIHAALPENINLVPASPNSLQITTENANKGYPNAQFKLGEIYSEGNGVPKDYNEAFKWFTKAAGKGHSTAQFNLAKFYYEGIGVSQDYNEALKWMTKSAEKGYSDAQLNLGKIYLEGNIVPKDYNESFKWFTKSANKGHPEAQIHLALMYCEGKGVIEDYVEAYKWFLIAAMNGKDVGKMKQDLSVKMSPDQIAEAQKLAKDFIAKKKNAVNNGPIEPNSSTNEIKDDVREKRVYDQIQKLEDTIEIAEKQIESLPPLDSIKYRHLSLEERLDVEKRKFNILCEEERNYKKIIYLIKKNPNLGFDVMYMEKNLIECQGRIEDTKLDIEKLRERLDDFNRRPVNKRQKSVTVQP